MVLWLILGTVFSLLSSQVMAIQYRILNDKLIQMGVVEEFSEKSSTVTYISSDSSDVHVEKVSSTSSDLYDDKDHHNELTIWQLFLMIQTGCSVPEKFTMTTSFLTGQPLYLVQSNSEFRHNVRGFRFENSDGGQFWDILILVHGNSKKLRGSVIRGVIVLVNGRLSNVIIPPGDWTKIKTICVEKLKLLNPRRGNETLNISVYQHQPPPSPPPSPPAYMNILKVNLAGSAQQ